MAYQSKHHKSVDTLLKLDGVVPIGLSLREFDKKVFEQFGAVCGIDEAGSYSGTRVCGGGCA